MVYLCNMARTDTQQLATDVYNIVGQIPRGRVLTYGDIARLAGCPNHSRLVGHLLSVVPSSLRLPCHRVVNASGRLAPNWPEQRLLLEREGVAVKTDNHGVARIRLKDYRWEVM
jgi:methylated-DNA-protein-cysteine methyltransferase-like protein